MRDSEDPDISSQIADALQFSTIRYDPQLESCGSNPLNGGQPTNIYLVTYHHQRLVEVAEYLGWSKALKILGNVRDFHRLLDTAIQDAPAELKALASCSLRIRATIGQHGIFGTTIQEAPALSLHHLFPTSLDMYLWGQPSEVSDPVRVAPADITKLLTDGVWPVIICSAHTTASPLTTFKHDKREFYNEARKQVQDRHDCSSYAMFEAILIDDEGRILDGSFTTIYFHRDSSWVTPPTGIGKGRWGSLRSTTRRWALDKGLALESHVDAQTVGVGERVVLSNGLKGFLPGVVVRNLGHEAK